MGGIDLDWLRKALRAGPDASPATSDFDLFPGARPPGATAGSLRPAAVLVALCPAPVDGPSDGRGGLNVILTRRCASLRNHPGQIAFPGGRQDKADPGPIATALREAQEEIGLGPAQVQVLGQLAPHETVTGFRVVPVIGLVSAPFCPRPQPSEVAAVFQVPLAYLADRANYRTEQRLWHGQARAYLTIPYGPWYIWGATARILASLAARLGEEHR